MPALRRTGNKRQVKTTEGFGVRRDGNVSTGMKIQQKSMSRLVVDENEVIEQRRKYLQGALLIIISSV